MKKYLYSTLLCSMLAATSCSDFLSEESRTKLSEEQVFGNQENIELLLSGLYTQWRNTRQDRNGLYLTLGTDEGKQGGQQVVENGTQASLDKYNGAFSAPNPTIGDLWAKRWPIVSEAAKAAHYATNSKLKARASFLRAAVNFELAMYWGEIPVINLENMREARQPLKDVYELIVADLEYAAANLPLPGQEPDPKFPTSGTAHALLGKVYLYAPEESTYRSHSKAIEHFDIAIPYYTLVDTYGHLWDTKHENSTESIYAFQFTNLYPDNNMVQHHAGSRAVADVDGKTYFGGYDLALATEHYYKDIDDGGVWEDGDTRKEASLRYDFTLPDGRVPSITWTGQADELEPHTRKFEDIRTQGIQGFWDGGVDIYFLRLSDILLCKAECMNELGQTADAVTLVNTTVRKRAFGGTLPIAAEWSTAMSKGDFQTNIMEERMRELGFEGWRRMDLIRTGKFVELVKERNKWAKESGTIQPFHALYPIPESEIKQNELINEDDQNPGY